MGRPRTFRYVGYAAIVVLLLAVAIRINYRRADETPTERAHRTCGQCGLSPDRVEQLIDNMAHSVLDRDELLELFYGTFDEDDPDPELCRPCADAVLDAACQDQGPSREACESPGTR